MPPGSSAQQDWAGARPAEDSRVVGTYWEIKRKLIDARRRLVLEREERARDVLSAEIEHLERQSVDIENYAKSHGLWGAVLRGKPPDPVVVPSGGWRPSGSRGAPASRVAEVTYGYGREQYRPWSSTGGSTREEAQFAPSVKVSREAGEYTRAWDAELIHTRAIGALMADHSNVDRATFRDSHHDGGWKRTLTRLLWAGFAVGLETFGVGASRRILGGDVPFDFIPRSPGE